MDDSTFDTSGAVIPRMLPIATSQTPAWAIATHSALAGYIVLGIRRQRDDYVLNRTGQVLDNDNGTN